MDEELPFITKSLAERWNHLTDGNENPEHIVEELAVSYRSHNAVERRNLNPDSVLKLLRSLIFRLDSQDSALLSCLLTLLRFIADDHASLFLKQIFILFEKVQELIVHPNHSVRNSTLYMTATLSTLLSFQQSVKSTLVLLEQRSDNFDHKLRLACISLLKLTIQTYDEKISMVDSTDQHTAKSFVVRIANSAILKLCHNVSSASNERSVIGVQEAAIDTVVAACLALHSLNYLNSNLSKLQYRILADLLSNCDSHHDGSNIHLDVAIKDEIHRRIRLIEFPSLATYDDTLLAIVRPTLLLVHHHCYDKQLPGDAEATTSNSTSSIQKRDNVDKGYANSTSYDSSMNTTGIALRYGAANRDAALDAALADSSDDEISIKEEGTGYNSKGYNTSLNYNITSGNTINSSNSNNNGRYTTLSFPSSRPSTSAYDKADSSSSSSSTTTTASMMHLQQQQQQQQQQQSQRDELSATASNTNLRYRKMSNSNNATNSSNNNSIDDYSDDEHHEPPQQQQHKSNHEVNTAATNTLTKQPQQQRQTKTQTISKSADGIGSITASSSIAAATITSSHGSSSGSSGINHYSGSFDDGAMFMSTTVSADTTSDNIAVRMSSSQPIHSYNTGSNTNYANNCSSVDAAAAEDDSALRSPTFEHASKARLRRSRLNSASLTANSATATATATSASTSFYLNSDHGSNGSMVRTTSNEYTLNNNNNNIYNNNFINSSHGSRSRLNSAVNVIASSQQQQQPHHHHHHQRDLSQSSNYSTNSTSNSFDYEDPMEYNNNGGGYSPSPYLSKQQQQQYQPHSNNIATTAAVVAGMTPVRHSPPSTRWGYENNSNHSNNNSSSSSHSGVASSSDEYASTGIRYNNTTATTSSGGGARKRFVGGNNVTDNSIANKRTDRNIIATTSTGGAEVTLPSSLSALTLKTSRSEDHLNEVSSLSSPPCQTNTTTTAGGGHVNSTSTGHHRASSDAGIPPHINNNNNATNNYDYISSEDITPCKTSPVQEMSKALQGLEVQDWPEIFHTLNTFRKLALHHPSVLLNSGTLHNVVLLIMKRVDNLRSCLAKNAILTIGDMITGLGRNIDTEAGTIIPGLLKRSSDSSAFIVESADAALQILIDNISVTRSLAGFLANTTHRNHVLRGKVATCLHSLVYYRRTDELLAANNNSGKELDHLKTALPKLLQDQNPDTRAHSRQIVRILLEKNVTSRQELSAVYSITGDAIDKIMREVPTVSANQLHSSSSGSGSGDSSNNTISSAARYSPVRAHSGGAVAVKYGSNSSNNNNSSVHKNNHSSSHRGGSGGATTITVLETDSSSYNYSDEEDSNSYYCSSAATTPGKSAKYNMFQQHYNNNNTNNGGKYNSNTKQQQQFNKPPTGHSHLKSDSIEDSKQQHQQKGYMQEHDKAYLAVSSQQLSVSLDAHLASSPLPARRNNREDHYGSNSLEDNNNNHANIAIHRKYKTNSDSDDDSEEVHAVALGRYQLQQQHAINKAAIDSPIVARSQQQQKHNTSSNSRPKQIIATAISPLPASSSSTNNNSSSNSNNNNRKEISTAAVAAAKRALESDPELSCLSEFIAATTVKSWSDRKDAIDKMTALMIRHYAVLRDANKLSVCVDSILNRLEDGSVKVHIHALCSLENIIEREPLILQQNLLQIVAPAILGSASSTNKQISSKSITLLRALFDTLSPSQVAVYLCHTALHEKDKLRLSALKFISDVTPVFCVDADTVALIVKKTIFPALCTIMFTSVTKGDVRVAAVDCMRSLQYNLRGEKLWLWSDEPHQQEEIKRLTATPN